MPENIISLLNDLSFSWCPDGKILETVVNNEALINPREIFPVT